MPRYIPHAHRSHHSFNPGSIYRPQKPIQGLSDKDRQELIGPLACMGALFGLIFVIIIIWGD